MRHLALNIAFMSSALALILAPQSARAATVHLIGGKSVEGEVLSITEKVVRVKTEHGEVPIPVERIVRPDADTLKKADKAGVEGNYTEARRLSEIVIFWEPTNAEAQRIRTQAVEKLAAKDAQAGMASHEKEAVEATQTLRSAASKMAANPPPDVNVFQKELTELRAATAEAAELYKDTAQAQPLAALLGSMDDSLGKVNSVVRQKAETRQKEVEMTQKISIAKAAQEQGTGSANGPKILSINKAGSAVDIRKNSVPGAITLIDFYADWCGPCKQLAPELEAFARNNKMVFLRKVDIKEWKSPVAQQYELRSIPSVWVIGKDGKIVAERLNGMQNIQQAVRAAMQ